ncbi:hypothetical protein [Microbacterium sp. USHLN186]|uniref:hypothetical protein n=1 Tax=Microbacterium sp. USHLN186 TaxID=3081286 RepID=UPI00301B40F9
MNPTVSRPVRGRRAAASLTALAVLGTTLAGMAGVAPAAAAGSTEKKTVATVLQQDRDALLGTDLLELNVPQQATILTPEQFAENDTRSAIVRLDNQKIAFMTKDRSGKPQEFVSMATETGFWDSLACGGVYEKRSDKLFSCVTAPQSPFYQDGDYEKGMREAFRQMKEDYDFNTVQLTVNWAEWDKTVDPAHPVFDYAKLDQLTEWASDAGLKVFWVLFFHIQTNMPDYAGARGVYNIADEGPYSYGIQWGKGLEKVSDYPHDAWNAVPELYPEYWHPVVHKQLETAMTDIATHFKDSDTVLGYQIGNEEGVTGPFNNNGDTNPYYAAMYELWHEKTGSTDKKTFRKELGLSVWQSMVESVRAVDPYKAITTNFQSSDVDKYPTGNTAGGQDLDFYRDAGLDLIAPMYYGGTESIRGNIDRFYGSSDSELSAVAQELPALFPSEIGIGYERGAVTQSDILDTLARGGIGFGLYAFGEMQALAPKMQRLIKDVMAMTAAYEDELWSAQPVSAKTTQNIHMTTSDANMTLATLETVDPDVALGLLWRDYQSAAGSSGVRPVEVSVKTGGTYAIEVMVNGQKIAGKTATVEAGGTIGFSGIEMDEIGSAFIKVSKKR